MPRAALAAAAALAVLGLAGCGGGSGDDERSQAIEAAQRAFADARSSRVDLGRGPCIAERLDGLDDWVVDVAHEPRTAVDDQPANQCARFRSGAASHFVELDPRGELIRAQ